MNCLCCDESITPEVSWDNIFSFSAPSELCPPCNKMLYMMQKERCTRCSREYNDDICPDCRQWDAYYTEGDPLSCNYSLYTYNAKMQEILARWKYRGDYQLGEIFRQSYRETFKAQFSSEAVIVPIPLSQERIAERAFNQAAMLASFLPGKIHPLLTRTHMEKQSKKSKIERLQTTNPFKMMDSIEKPAILVDDLYTTGMTLRHAAALLKANGSPEVYAYTLIRA